MDADLIKQKITLAVQKINLLKDDLHKKERENDNLKQERADLLKVNEELDLKILMLEEELQENKKSNEDTVKDIDLRLSELNSLLGENSNETTSNTENSIETSVGQLDSLLSENE